jgi:hypothetical protein
VSACFDNLDGDDAPRIIRGLEAMAALLDAGAAESLVAAEFRRRGLSDGALELRLHVIRARRASAT